MQSEIQKNKNQIRIKTIYYTKNVLFKPIYICISIMIIITKKYKNASNNNQFI